MQSRLWFVLSGVLGAAMSGAAFAGDIPLDDAGFTAYVAQKVQLYSPAPVRVTSPFNIAIGPPSGVNLVYGFAPLHDACVAAPAQCDDRMHDYIQSVVRRFPAANSGPSPNEALPADKPGFMAAVAAELGKLLPGATVEADGMVLKVTRPGGHAIPFDQSGYYQLCGESNFNCKAAMLQSLARTAAWLGPLEPGRLRSSLHIIDGCKLSAGSPDCAVKPSTEPMAPFVRRAFANLEELCFKTIGDKGIVPATNADRRDRDLSVNAALDLCGASTHDVLGPLSAKLSPPAADGIVTIAAPYAASYALFPADWAGLAAGGPLIVALPTRDTLLYMTSDGEAAVAALGARAAAGFAGAPFGISSDVYRWGGKDWVLATAASTMNAPADGH